MTKKEAEKYIKSKMCNNCGIYLGGGKCSNNCNVIEALQALSQEPICDRDCEHCTWTECPIEPCDDAVSRPTVVKFEGTNMACMGGDEIMKEFENNTQKNNDDDVISRKSIKQKLQEHHDFFVNAYGGFSNLPQNDKARVDEITNCIAMVVNEPSVTQKPKTGQWIDTGSGQECSECHEIQYGYDNYRFYCGYCGARMVEPQESNEISDRNMKMWEEIFKAESEENK